MGLQALAGSATGNSVNGPHATSLPKMLCIYKATSPNYKYLVCGAGMNRAQTPAPLDRAARIKPLRQFVCSICGRRFAHNNPAGPEAIRGLGR